MKKTFILFASLMLTLASQAQTVSITKKNGSVDIFRAALVDHVAFSEKAPDIPAKLVSIDLGLPSGTRWANMNIGANAPEENGYYFIFGKTKAYTDDTTTDFNAGDAAGDAATLRWNTMWQVPTFEQMQELVDCCETEWTTFNGVNGYRFTSKDNGNFIFMPAAGFRSYSSMLDTSIKGCYWSSTESLSKGYARGLELLSDGINYFDGNSVYAFSVRPVLVRK